MKEVALGRTPSPAFARLTSIGYDDKINVQRSDAISGPTTNHRVNRSGGSGGL